MMTLWQFLSSAWIGEPSVVAGCAALLVWYLVVVRGRFSHETGYFVAGVLVLLLALVSPLDTLGDIYLFSAHMLQHLLLVLVAPPLLLLGIPPALAERAVRQPWLKRMEEIFRQPVLAFVVGISTLAIWHLPVLYDATLADERIHIVEHLMFLASAMIFWLPVFTPLREKRLTPIATMLYLMPAASITTLLGILIAYSPNVLYSAYLHPVDPFGILPLLQQQRGLTPKNDQEIAGLFMWVPGSFVYLGVIMLELWRWFGSFEEQALG